MPRLPAGLPQITGEREVSLLPVPTNKIIKMGFKDGQISRIECAHLFLVTIHAYDPMADFGQTGPSDEPHVSGSSDTNVHMKASST